MSCLPPAVFASQGWPLLFHPCPASVQTSLGTPQFPALRYEAALPGGRSTYSFFCSLLPPVQYYEMSYGLNIEMHKQVGEGVSKFSNSWGRCLVCRALPSITLVVFWRLEMP